MDMYSISIVITVINLITLIIVFLTLFFVLREIRKSGFSAQSRWSSLYLKLNEVKKDQSKIDKTEISKEIKEEMEKILREEVRKEIKAELKPKVKKIKKEEKEEAEKSVKLKEIPIISSTMLKKT
jgi:biopolymer transport protein ExbB/TolQ